MMRNIVPMLFGILLMALACRQPAKQVGKRYTTVDYVKVGALMDSIKPPYVIDLSKSNKHLVFIGCDHNRDSTHKQFKIIEQYFESLKPQIAFNEGGKIADSVHYKSLNQAATAHGEVGTLKYLSDKAGISMMDGDISDSLEFSITLKRYPADKLLLYYLMERVVIPYLNGAYGEMPFDELYAKAINKWFKAEGFPINQKQMTAAYFRQLYKKYTGNNFQLKLNADIEKFDYINPNCEFCAIGRTSKMTRDSVLLDKIDHALTKYDRVIVTFGHGHALAVEPALKQIIDNK